MLAPLVTADRDFIRDAIVKLLQHADPHMRTAGAELLDVTLEKPPLRERGALRVVSA